MADSPPQKKRRGRKPSSKIDVEARLQKSRQSARECRARKKMRYKSLEDIIAHKEAENLKLRDELEDCLDLCEAVENGEKVSDKVIKKMKEDIEIDTEEETQEEEND
eukprot:gene11809-13033_t